MQAPFLEQTLAALQLGAPLQFRNLTLYPLLADGLPEPDYLTLDEALAGGHIRITEVSESGSVPELYVDNPSAYRVLLLDGEEITGAKQNRVLNVSILVPPGSRVKVPVSCVEQGRWAWKHRHFESKGRALFARARGKKARSVSASYCMTGVPRSDQGQVWRDVEEMVFSRKAHAPSMAMEDVYEHERATLADFEQAFSATPRQAGAVFAINGQIEGLELFGASGSFGKYLGKLVKSYAMDAIAQSESEGPLAAGAPDEQAARAFIDQLLHASARSYQGVAAGEDLRLESERLAGGALLDEARLVHLAAFNQAHTAAKDMQDE